MASIFLDTIHLPDGALDDTLQTRVRPALAVLFRVAVGPAADYYAPRFLKYEQAGHSGPGWHWPSFVWPSIWAFYRKLWLAGLAFALLPLAGAFAFVMLAQRIDNASVPMLLGAAVAIWLLPGIISALLANSLLYRRVRRMVRQAEEGTRSPAQVASLLASAKPTSLLAALALGGSAILMSGIVAAPSVRGAWFEHEVRVQIAAALASVQPFQQQVEQSWNRFRAIPVNLDVDALRLQAAAAVLAEVSFRPANGRLRLGLGASIPSLVGRSILLAPSVDSLERIQWTCIPIDIPAKFLPKECQDR
ncbi:MAG: DUF2628 domain-containing protein [Betaproteobacteria bacterium]